MAVSFASDSNNDFIIENGEFVLVSDGAQVAQNVRERLLFYLDDYFLNRNLGVPYFQVIFQKPVDLAEVESILKQTIIQTDGVDQLLTFLTTFDPVTRKMTIATSFNTVFDTIEGVTLNA